MSITHKSSFALEMSRAAKKQSEEIKNAIIILTRIYSNVVYKIESHNCHWNNTFTCVNVADGTNLPLTIIEIDDFVTTMRDNYYKFLADKFSELGFSLGDIYYKGSILECMDLHVKKNEK